MLLKWVACTTWHELDAHVKHNQHANHNKTPLQGRTTFLPVRLLPEAPNSAARALASSFSSPPRPSSALRPEPLPALPAGSAGLISDSGPPNSALRASRSTRVDGGAVGLPNVGRGGGLAGAGAGSSSDSCKHGANMMASNC